MLISWFCCTDNVCVFLILICLFVYLLEGLALKLIYLFAYFTVFVLFILFVSLVHFLFV